MNTNTHPIDLLIVLTLEMLEGIAWFINEFTGGHPAPATVEFWDNCQTVEAIISHHEQQQFTEYEAEMNREPSYEELADYAQHLTVKQLQTIVGTKNSRLRKAELIALAIG